jgi:hypothetical protein
MNTIAAVLIKFMALFNEAEITPRDENDGRPTYDIVVDGQTFEHAYAEEVINYLVTGKFQYDEDLTLLNSGVITYTITFDTINQ